MRVLNQRREADSYSEREAAELLGITLERLHKLLDENIFNDGSSRPADLRLQDRDLILLEFWNRTTENPKIVRMPNRG
jgi:hypothetical protein